MAHPSDEHSRKRMNFLYNEMMSLYHEAALKTGLSDSALEILYTLYDAGDPCPQKAVYQNTGRSRSTINSSIRSLERSGVLYLEADGRCTHICLTPKGQALLDTAVRPLAEAESAILSQWSDQEQQAYLTLTERYLTALREKLSTLYTGEHHENPTL